MAYIKLKITKSLSLNLLQLFIFFGLVTCFTDKYYEEKNKADNSKIYFKDAQQRLMFAVTSLADRCQSFTSSGYNYNVSYTIMIAGDPCLSTINIDLIKGCSDKHYLNKKDVDFCISEIIGDPCDETGSPPEETQASTNYRFSTFAYCSNVFKSNYPMPMFL